MASELSRFFGATLGVLVVVVLTIQVGVGQQPAGPPGGTYAGLDARRQGLVRRLGRPLRQDHRPAG